MKLALGLCLSSLICSVYALQCLQCVNDSGQCRTTNSLVCPAGSGCSAAMTYFAQSGGGGFTSVQRYCNKQDNCTFLNATSSGITFSATTREFSFYTFISCCYFDNCNNINVSEPNNTLNGLKCATCDDQANVTCNSTVSCVGNQDHCATLTVLNSTAKGCVSKSLCGSTSFGNLTCCTGNLCNGNEAWRLRLDLSLLLMTLLATILLPCPLL